MRKDCDFSMLRKIMLPPSAVTIPRTELPMEQLLNIQPGADGSRKVSSPSRVSADCPASNALSEEKESDDHEILRIFDGNNSLRNQVFRTASVLKTATVDQIRDTAMRRYHINDTTPTNYYVTQAPFDRN